MLMPESNFTECNSKNKDDDSFACLLDEERCVELLREIRWPDGTIIGNLVRGSIFYQRVTEKLGVEVEADEV